MKGKLKELTIEITQKCPNACIFCSSLSSCTSDTCLDLADVCRVGWAAAGLGLREVSVSGGEPLCHPQIEAIAAGLREAGLGVSLYTTGLMLHGNATVPFLDWSILRRDLTRVVFNIQSTQDAVHDRLVGRTGALRLTKRSLTAALQAGIEVEIHIVPNAMNIESIESSVADLVRWGIMRVSFLRMVYQGSARAHLEDLFLDASRRQQLRLILSRLAQNVPDILVLRFGIPFSADVERPMHCTAGIQKMIVRYDGKVLPCEAFKDADDEAFVLGDIQYDTLEQMLDRGATNTSLCELRKIVCNAEPCLAQLLHI